MQEIMKRLGGFILATEQAVQIVAVWRRMMDAGEQTGRMSQTDLAEIELIRAVCDIAEMAAQQLLALGEIRMETVGDGS